MVILILQWIVLRGKVVRNLGGQGIETLSENDDETRLEVHCKTGQRGTKFLLMYCGIEAFFDRGFI